MKYYKPSIALLENSNSCHLTEGMGRESKTKEGDKKRGAQQPCIL